MAINSLFQIFTFSLYAWAFIAVFPGLLGLEGTIVEAGFLAVFNSVLIYLGIPFALGILGRMVLTRLKSRDGYGKVYLPCVAPMAVLALIFTIFVMFSLQGEQMMGRPFDVLWVAIPMSLYFVVMFLASFLIAHRLGVDYSRSATLAITAAGNNFELAIAAAIAVFGIASPVAFATAIGPLVEVPVLIGSSMSAWHSNAGSLQDAMTILTILNRMPKRMHPDRPERLCDGRPVSESHPDCSRTVLHQLCRRNLGSV